MALIGGKHFQDFLFPPQKVSRNSHNVGTTSGGLVQSCISGKAVEAHWSKRATSERLPSKNLKANFLGAIPATAGSTTLHPILLI